MCGRDVWDGVGEHDQICILAKSEVKNSWREWVIDIENLVERVVIDS